MKARVGTTGEIVTLDTRNYVTEVSEGGRPRMWRLAELEFEGDLDYWTRLEHQYAGMAMQGLVTRGEVLGSSVQEIARDIAEISCEIAHTLVERLKEKEERK